MNVSDIRPGWQLPLQWPRAADYRSLDRHALLTERLHKAAILFAMLALTVLAR